MVRHPHTNSKEATTGPSRDGLSRKGGRIRSVNPGHEGRGQREHSPVGTRVAAVTRLPEPFARIRPRGESNDQTYEASHSPGFGPGTNAGDWRLAPGTRADR